MARYSEPFDLSTKTLSDMLTLVHDIPIIIVDKDKGAELPVYCVALCEDHKGETSMIINVQV